MRVLGTDFVEVDVCNRFQTPVETCPLGMGEHQGELLELGSVKEEEAGTMMVDGCTMFSIGRVRDGDVVEDGKAGASGFEFSSNDLKKIRDLQALEVESTRCRCWSD